jgi:hypothetical protein
MIGTDTTGNAYAVRKIFQKDPPASNAFLSKMPQAAQQTVAIVRRKFKSIANYLSGPRAA